MSTIFFANKETGIFTQCSQYSLAEFENGVEYSNMVAFTVDDIIDNVLNKKYLSKSLEVKVLPIKPSKYHIWNLETEQWQEPENYQQLLFDEAASKVKLECQRLLATTDWTDTVSASTRLENYNAWQFYRQQLRDITTQEGYPFNVEWPTQPV
jgi:D-mannonate dehydratase